MQRSRHTPQVKSALTQLDYFFCLIHPTAQSRNSAKFAVASDPSNTAAGARQRHGGTASDSERGDYVVVVAALCIKELRLATAQMPEKTSPLGPRLDRTSP